MAKAGARSWCRALLGQRSGPRPRRLGVLLLLAGLQALPSLAHEETPFEIAADGILLGYPEEYGPAQVLVVGNGAGRDAAKREVTIRTGGHELRLPPCLAEFFFHPRVLEIQARGSWYHSFEVLPPYLYVVVATEGPPGPYAGVSFMFNMRTAELIDASSPWYPNARFGKNELVASLCDQNERALLATTPNSAGTILLLASIAVAIAGLWLITRG